MDEQERLNALDVALNNEMREREFYLNNARRTKNEVGRAMFQQIADEELEHYERLKQLHETWGKRENGLRPFRLRWKTPSSRMS